MCSSNQNTDEVQGKYSLVFLSTVLVPKQIYLKVTQVVAMHTASTLLNVVLTTAQQTEM